MIAALSLALVFFAHGILAGSEPDRAAALPPELAATRAPQEAPTLEREAVFDVVEEERVLGLHTLRGRLFDSGGSAVDSLAVECAMRASHGSSWRWTARRPSVTDRDGRFELTTDFGSGVTRLQVEVRVGDWKSSTLAARTELDIDVSGVTELGDLVVEPIAFLASGTVRGLAGAPLRNAIVRAEDCGTRGAPTLMAVTDGEGRFELRGAARGKALLATAHCERYLRSEEIEIDVGSNNTDFELRLAGLVAGEIWADSWVPQDALVVTCCASSRQGRWKSSRSSALAFDGSFCFLELEPGLYDVAVLARQSGERLFEAKNLEVFGGELDRQPELAPIDLRSALHGAAVSVRDAYSRARVRGAWLHCSVDAAIRTFRCGSGQTTIVTRAERLDIAASAAGYSIASAREVGGELDLALEPAPTIHLALPPQFEWPASAARIVATLEFGAPFDAEPPGPALAAALQAIRPQTVRLARDGTVPLTVAVPGRYVASFTAYRTDLRGRSHELASLGSDPTQTIDVRACDSGAKIFVDLPETQLALWR